MGSFLVRGPRVPTVLFPLAGAAIDLWFANNQYTTALAGVLSCSRASTGYAKNSSGTWVSFGNDTLRITDLGLLVEDARTNNLLNSATPITQTTGILATGVYTLWVEGTGSALASGGTATITGAASATNGSPNVFTVTVGGTVIVTVTGSLDRFQLELGSFPSSFISTTVTAATRAADAVTCVGSLDTVLKATDMSLVIDETVLQTFTGAEDPYGFVTQPSFYYFLYTDGVNSHVVSYDGPGNHGLTATIGNSRSHTLGAKLGLAQDVNGRSIVGGGGTVATDANVVDSAGTIRLGGSGTGPTPGSFMIFRRLTAWNSRLADATLQGFTAP